MTERTSIAEKYRILEQANVESAKIILRDADKLGEGSLAVQWARAVLEGRNVDIRELKLEAL